ncbi:MAG: twin-arginine translocase TatA/TatE family subunit [Candidatus Limnocylindria bacterium]
MGPIGWPELVLILVVVLVIFGPGKLPDVGNAIGRGIREFRKASNELEESVRGEPRRTPPPQPQRQTPAAPAAGAAEPAQDTAETPTH